MSSRRAVPLGTMGLQIGTAFGSLAANRMRSLLTMLGIVIGISTMTTVASLLQGFGSEVTDSLNRLGTSTLYIERNEGPSMGGGPGRLRESRPELETSFAGEIAEIEGVRVSIPLARSFASVKTQDGADISVQLMGTEAAWLDATRRELSSGRFLTGYEVTARREVCVIGSDVGDRLFGEASPIGEGILLGGTRLTVVGVLESRGEAMGTGQDDVVVVPWTIFSRWGDLGRNLAILVEVEDPAAMDSMIEVVTTRMRMLRGLSTSDPDDFEILTSEELREGFSSISAWLSAGLLGLAGLALLVGSVGIANIMLVSVTQRTREIGLRKALGARRSQILAQFLTESTLLSLTGGAAGILAGIGAAEIVSAMTGIPAGIEAWTLATAVAVSGISGILAGLFPASRAAAMEPLRALSHSA